jgi:hypothetical protein
MTRATRRITRIGRLISGSGPGSKPWRRVSKKTARWDRKAKK